MRSSHSVWPKDQQATSLFSGLEKELGMEVPIQAGTNMLSRAAA